MTTTEKPLRFTLREAIVYAEAKRLLERRRARLLIRLTWTELFEHYMFPTLAWRFRVAGLIPPALADPARHWLDADASVEEIYLNAYLERKRGQRSRSGFQNVGSWCEAEQARLKAVFIAALTPYLMD
ncbi:hypothetical protein [Rhodomicrobium lacus]|uniref:hypothetical protein n=1 Tax=Rhodomicrobium lacus TaxID=2498452 RepID=UPI0026E446FB|nr:hypothetical protein [Rhodomicrobium lacus]WKW50722.1 hypothetical protein QMO75_15850 [Rhodomicrobium lacus]